MAIHPICDKCGRELDKLGGILLSPPDQDNKVTKLHLCIDCYEQVESSITK